MEKESYTFESSVHMTWWYGMVWYGMLVRLILPGLESWPISSFGCVYIYMCVCVCSAVVTRKGAALQLLSCPSPGVWGDAKGGGGHSRKHTRIIHTRTTDSDVQALQIRVQQYYILHIYSVWLRAAIHLYNTHTTHHTPITHIQAPYHLLYLYISTSIL